MNQWPSSIRPPDQRFFGKSKYKPIMKHEFEANYVQTAPKFSRARRRFTLGWSALPDDEYDTLDAFFEQVAGDTFEWKHPITDEIIIVMFGSGEMPEATWTGMFQDGQDAWSLSGLVLEEQ